MTGRKRGNRPRRFWKNRFWKRSQFSFRNPYLRVRYRPKGYPKIYSRLRSWWLFYWEVLTAAVLPATWLYRGEFSRLKSAGRHRKSFRFRYIGVINTVKDLVGSGLNWGATDNAWIASITGDTHVNDFLNILRGIFICIWAICLKYVQTKFRRTQDEFKVTILLVRRDGKWKILNNFRKFASMPYLYSSIE